MVVNELETNYDLDFNGVILLSQILNFDLSADGPQFNPGTDQAYIAALPTYAATAWYHNLLAGGRPGELEPFLKQVEAFASGDYALALQAGAELDPARRQAIAEQYAKYTGLTPAYVLKADLRVDGGMFEKMLQDQDGLTTGRLDTRFSGPDMDPLSKEADYDPQSAAISSAYVSAFNDYVRKQLGFGEGKTYKPEIDVGIQWKLDHQPPGLPFAVPGIPERHDGPGGGDEIQPEPEGDGQRRLLRPRHCPHLRGLGTRTTTCRSRPSCRAISSTTTTSPATWFTPTKPR